MLNIKDLIYKYLNDDDKELLEILKLDDEPLCLYLNKEQIKEDLYNSLEHKGERLLFNLIEIYLSDVEVKIKPILENPVAFVLSGLCDKWSDFLASDWQDINICNYEICYLKLKVLYELTLGNRAITYKKKNGNIRDILVNKLELDSDRVKEIAFNDKDTIYVIDKEDSKLKALKVMNIKDIREEE